MSGHPIAGGGGWDAAPPRGGVDRRTDWTRKSKGDFYMNTGLTCLYVEDEPGVREVVALNLRAEGIKVHVAENGLGVERMVEEIQPDIVLLDVMMPGRDGYDVLRSLKGN